jgi:hypothetical protein
MQPRSKEILDRFLERVSRDLQPSMNVLELKDTVEELRSHLIASASAHEAFGLSSEESMMAAVRALGDSHSLSANFAKESRKSMSDLAVSLAAGALAGFIAECFLNVMFGLHSVLIWHGRYVPDFKFGILLGLVAGLANHLRPGAAKTAAYTWCLLLGLPWTVLAVTHLRPGIFAEVESTIFALLNIAGTGALLGYVSVILKERANRFRTHYRLIPPRFERVT